MDLALENQVVIVTGGAKGIGAAIVELLAAEGAVPVIVGRNAPDNAAQLSRVCDAGGRALAITAELGETADCERAVRETVEQLGRVDGLVNNAGINDGISLSQGTTEQFLTSLRRNLVHYFDMARFCLPHLRATKGAIVNIGSKVAETGQGGTSAYAAANGGRNALTREWAVELLGDEIRVNAVIVAECWTPLYEKWINTLSDPQETLARIEARIPLGKRMTSSEEIANAVAFLLSPRSSHTTGQLLHIDGGYTHLDRALA